MNGSPPPPDRPWDALPPEVAMILRPELPALAEEMIEAIREIPEYSRPLEGQFGVALRAGVEEALAQFLRLIEEPGLERGEWAGVYRALGRAEMREGRSLDSLQAAYRLGARIAWRRFAAAGSGAGLPPETLHLLAEAIFAYIDELAADSVEGYARAQSAAAGERERRRAVLLALLLERPSVELRAVRQAARDAHWRLPRTLAAVALEPDADARVIAARLGPDALGGDDGAGSRCLILPDPEGPGRRAIVERALPGAPAAIGPAVPPADARRSLDWARQALDLARRGVIEGGGLVDASDHLVALALMGGEDRLRELYARRLAPLHRLRPAVRRRLEETLLAWLRAGSAPAAARALHVHPQTVRYRLAQLGELLGDALEDADARFEIELSLRFTRLAG
jgi:hypothetical protein